MIRWFEILNPLKHKLIHMISTQWRIPFKLDHVSLTTQITHRDWKRKTEVQSCSSFEQNSHLHSQTKDTKNEQKLWLEPRAIAVYELKPGPEDLDWNCTSPENLDRHLKAWAWTPWTTSKLQPKLKFEKKR